MAVTWGKEYNFRRWFEADVKKLVAELEPFTHVVTFNGNRFDLEVLNAYAPVDGFRRRSFDVHELLHKLLGIASNSTNLRKTPWYGEDRRRDPGRRWWRAGERIASLPIANRTLRSCAMWSNTAAEGIHDRDITSGTRELGLG